MRSTTFTGAYTLSSAWYARRSPTDDWLAEPLGLLDRPLIFVMGFAYVAIELKVDKQFVN